MEIVIKSRPIKLSPKLIYRPAMNILSILANHKPFALPSALQVEPAGNICNLRCNMCPINFMTRERAVMDYSLFTGLIKEVKPLYLCLTGMTESLMHKDIFKMIEFAKKYSTVKMDTNGTFLNEENVERILSSNLDIISVSIDSLNKEHYEAIRKGAELEPVLAGIELLSRRKRESGSRLQIHFAVILQKMNITDLPGVIKFAAEVGVDNLNASIMINFGIQKEEYNNLQISTDELETLGKVAEESKNLAQQLGLNANLGALGSVIQLNADYSRLSQSGACYIPWYSAYVVANGDVLPCCLMFDGQVKFGNIGERSFSDIWFSPEYQDFRKRLLQGKSGYCYGCSVSENDIHKKLKKVPFSRIK